LARRELRTGQAKPRRGPTAAGFALDAEGELPAEPLLSDLLASKGGLNGRRSLLAVIKRIFAGTVAR